MTPVSATVGRAGDVAATLAQGGGSASVYDDTAIMYDDPAVQYDSYTFGGGDIAATIGSAGTLSADEGGV